MASNISDKSNATSSARSERVLRELRRQKELPDNTGDGNMNFE